MPSNVDWITAAVMKARQKGAIAPDAVWIQLEAHLRGRFSERPIPAGELASVTMQLIDGMIPTPPQVSGPK